MATHDYVIANASGAAVRADLNNALAAIVSNNSNATEPATTYPYMWWQDTTTGLLKVRNAANDGWVQSVLLDDSGRLLVGTSTARTQANIFLPVQTETAGNSPYGGFGAITNSNDTVGAYLILSKSRGTSVGSNTIVQSGDAIGDIWFTGADGTDITTGAARITAYVDGTPGANAMPGRIVFSTNSGSVGASPTERMRIDNDGSIWGNFAFAGSSSFTTNTAGLKLLASSSGTGQVGAEIACSGSTLVQAMRFSRAGATAGSITIPTTGNIAYNASSDYRLKEDIQPVANSVDRLKALKPCSFKWIGSDLRVDGFIAHELQAVLPEVVTGEKDAVDENGDPVYQGIDQSKLVPLLTAALQEAVAKIEIQDAAIAALEARLAALEAN